MDGFDTERFVSEFESRQAIWNTDSREYSNENEKSKAWKEVCLLFYENFLGKESIEKNEVCKYFILF
jgi:hypothetical protein